MHAGNKRKRDVAVLTVAALGVVFGDIGTSPLYTLRECFAGHHPLALTEANILGVLSLIFWSLIVVVAIKYVSFIMRADNQGEGGVLALLALTKQVPIQSKFARHGLVLAAIFGAALFFGDGMITPAISVLSAVEGLKIAAPQLEQFVIPISLTILTALFFVQAKGTSKVGVWFGPIIIVWFITLAILGANGIAHNPHVLQALNPQCALHFFAEHGSASLLVMGSVLLAVTGGEALFADMGHFGRLPIKIAWFGLVLPALVLNYFGQGALLLDDQSVIENPFFHLAPEQFTWPLLLLATMATVIASQAVISGVFSIVRQAAQLSYWPRVLVKHTSNKEEGQIYIPLMNWVLYASVVALVIGFQSSSNLAAAYGIAVTGTMLVSTVLALVVARGVWHWHWLSLLTAGSFFILIDSTFFVSTLFKFVEGGWFPLLVGVMLLGLMQLWRRGRKIVQRRLNETSIPLPHFVDSLRAYHPITIPGTAIFMTSSLGRTPHALINNIQHNGVLHKRNILLTIITDKIPVVPMAKRFDIDELNESIIAIKAYFGFHESPDVMQLLKDLSTRGLDVNPSDTTFFISRDRVIASDNRGLPPIADNIFATMHRNAMSVTDYFNLPPNRVIEIGMQVEI